MRPEREIWRGVLWAATCCLAGCVSPGAGMVADVDPARWDTPVAITIPNADTTSLRKLALFLRLNDRFRDDTLTLRITVLTPDSLRSQETLRARIFGPQPPAARMRIADVPYRSRVRLARTGDYRLIVEPCRPLRGVEAIGAKLETNQ